MDGIVSPGKPAERRFGSPDEDGRELIKMSMISFLINNLRYILFNSFGFIFVFIILYKTVGIRYKLSTTIFWYTLLWLFRCFVFSMFIVNYLSDIYGNELLYHILLNASNIFVTVLGILFVRFLFKGNLQKNLLLFIGAELGVTFLLRVITFGISLFWPSYDNQAMINHFEMQDLLIPVFITLAGVLFLRYGDQISAEYRKWKPAHTVLLQVVLGSYFILGCFTNVALALSNSFEERGFIIFYAMMIIIFLLYCWIDYYHLTRLREYARHRELLRQESALIAYYEESLKQASRINQYQEEIREMMMRLVDKEEDNLDQMIHEYLKELKEQRDSLSVMRYCSDYTLDQFLSFHVKRLGDFGYATTMHFQDYHTPAGIMVTDVIEILHWMTTGILPEVDVPDPGSVVTGKQQSFSDNGPSPEEHIKGRITYHGAVIGQMLVLHCEAEGEGVKIPQMSHIRHIKRRIKVDIDVTAEQGRMRVLAGLPL